MTVVPDDHLMTLICDDCGDTTTGPACVLPDAEVVWTLVSEHGWSGSPFAVGPHRCPPCTITGPDGVGRSQPAAGADHVLGLDQVDDCGTPPADEGPLGAALRDAREVDGRVIVDLARVDVIDPAGLRLLVSAYQEARRRGATLCLVAPSRFVRTLLHTMRLDGAFPIFATSAEAVDGLVVAGATRLTGAAAMSSPARR